MSNSKYPAKANLWMEKGLKDLMGLVSKYTKMSQSEVVRLSLKHSFGLKMQEYEKANLNRVCKEVERIGGQKFLDL